MKVGVGKAKIVFPEELFPVEGFDGVHDDPFFRIVVIEQKEKIAIASIEIVKLEPPHMEEIRSIISEETGVEKDRIWLHMNHNLTTPHSPEQNRLKDGDTRQIEPLVEIYNKAINDAECDINESRDVKGDMGWWTGIHGTGPTDHRMKVVSFRSTEGRHIASMISYPVKPMAIDNTGMNDWNRKVSGDLTGVACGIVEEATGAPAMFMMPAAGDQGPVKQSWYNEFNEAEDATHVVDKGVEYGLAAAKELGSIMGAKALEADKNAVCEEADIRWMKTIFSWPEQTRGGRLIYPVAKEKLHPTGNNWDIPISAITLSSDTAFVFTKPEMSCITGMRLYEQSPYKNTLLVTMTDGDMKYMPNLEAYEQGLWEAANSMCMPGGAEEMTKEALQMLNTLKTERGE